MKKFLLMLLLFFGLVLVGCGETPSEKPSDEENKEENKDPNQEDNKPTEITIKNGTEVAKILLAQQRLDSSVFDDEDSIFNVGYKAFNNIIERTKFNNRKYSGRPNETYTEVDGDIYKWYNDVDYSNFISFFNSYAETIEHSAKRGVELIDYTKKYIRVVNKWVKQYNQEYLLIVTEDSEMIISRYDNQYIDICKRYTNEDGLSVYEMLQLSNEHMTRMKYIPGLVYEYSTKASNGYGHYLLADNHKGYWQVLSSNGMQSYQFEGNTIETNTMTYLVMKEEATYILDYTIESNGYSYLGNIRIVSSDGKSDLLSLSQNRIELFNTGVKGLNHLEIEASKDKVGDFDPNSDEKLYVYEQDNFDHIKGEYKIYSTSGWKSATAVCENGLSLTEGDVLLDEKVVVERIDVSYVAGCDSYGRIPFSTNATTLDEQFEILEELMKVTGLTFRRDYDTVISCLKYAIKDAQNFTKFFTINDYHITDLEDIKKAYEIEDNKFNDLLDTYNQVKDLKPIDIEDQETYNDNIYFSDIEILGGSITNDEFKVTINELKIKVKDTLLFVNDEEYMIVLGLLTSDEIITYISEEDLKTKYVKGEEFILTQTKEIQFDTLVTGEYVLVAYVALASEHIRITNYEKLQAEVIESVAQYIGYKNTIKNNQEGNLMIVSEVDYNIYVNVSGDYTYQDLENLLGQYAYDYGMIEDFIIEMNDNENWVLFEESSIEDDQPIIDDEIKEESSEEKQEGELSGNEETSKEEAIVFVEKGQYRMKYNSNAPEGVDNEYYIYVTIE